MLQGSRSNTPRTFTHCHVFEQSVPGPSPVASFPNDLGSAHTTYHDYGGKAAHGAYDTADANELYVYS